MTCLTAAQPGQPGSATLRQKCGVAILELSFELFDAEVFCGGNGRGFDGPAHVSSGNGLAFGVLPGPAHSIGEPFGEHETIRRRAVIIFAGANVATGAVEMDVQRRRDSQLPEETRNSGKVRVRNSGAVITLRMRSVVAQHRHGSLAIP